MAHERGASRSAGTSGPLAGCSVGLARIALNRLSRSGNAGIDARRGLLLAVALLFGAPHPADAGMVSIGEVRIDYKPSYNPPTMQFTAAPGERNQITVTRTGTVNAEVAVLHDAGAPVIATAACTRIDEHTVSCPHWYLDIDVGDGNDTVTLVPHPDGFGGGFVGGVPDRGYVRGGDGSDVLTGPGFLAGGAGNDVLTCPEPCRTSALAGGGDDDRLVGGSADGLLSGDADGPPQPIAYETRLSESATPGNDIVDGGPGRDTLTFRERRAGVTVNLTAGSSAGAGGERDRLVGIENVDGGSGDDVLIGDGADNVLQGDSGDDRIDARAGNDYLLGNLVPDSGEFSLTYTPPDPGADTLRGGAGDDRLDAGGERGDVLSGGAGNDSLHDDLSSSASHVGTVRCGSGRDLIAFTPRRQLLSDCELLRPSAAQAQLGLQPAQAHLGLRPRLRPRGRLRFAWTCKHPDGCAMALGVRVGSSPRTRRRTFTEGPGRRVFLVRPRPPARRGDVADIMIIVQGGDASPYGARWRIRL